MHSRVRGGQRAVPARRKTNWTAIFVIVALGIMSLAAMLFLSTRETPLPTLASYCEDYPERCAIRGAADADITIVEVSDYGCTHCLRYKMETEPQLATEYIDSGAVRYIVVPFALRAATVEAASSALCAQEQDAFEAMHAALFTLQGSPQGFSRSAIVDLAYSIGLNGAEMASCLQDGHYQQVVERNVQAASSVGVGGTPTFFVNWQKLEGPQPISVFRERIESLSGS